MTVSRIAKHQTRFRRELSKMRGGYRLSRCLTKGVQSCQGRPDTSQLVYLYPSPQCLEGLGHSPVLLRTRPIKKGFIGSFMLKRLRKMGLRHFPKSIKPPIKPCFECFSPQR